MSAVSKKHYRVLTVEFMYQSNNRIPYIHLQGNWLKKFGFQQGDKIEVEKQRGLLVIRPLVEETPIDSVMTPVTSPLFPP